MTIKIGPVEYEVRFQEMAAEDMGRIHFKRLVIEVDGTMPPIAQVRTLMHEVAHGVIRSLPGEDAEDEGLANAWGDTLLQVIQDNPWLVDLIRGDEPDLINRLIDLSSRRGEEHG